MHLFSCTPLLFKVNTLSVQHGISSDNVTKSCTSSSQFVTGELRCTGPRPGNEATFLGSLIRLGLGPFLSPEALSGPVQLPSWSPRRTRTTPGTAIFARRGYHVHCAITNVRGKLVVGLQAGASAIEVEAEVIDASRVLRYLPQLAD